MVLFLLNQQELDCISDSGQIIGQIHFDGSEDRHIFTAADGAVISQSEQSAIDQRIAGLDSGVYSIPMQDDD